MSLSTILIASSLVVSTYGYTCKNGTETINAPSDMSKSTFFPSSWNGDQPVPFMDSNQTCFVRVNVPSGYYANVTFYKNNKNPGGYVYYSNRKIRILLNNDYAPWIFTDPYFNVYDATENENGPGVSEFAFKIVWTKFPNVNKNFVDVHKGQTPVALKPNGDLTVLRGDPSSMMSLVAFEVENPEMGPTILRQTLIFGGDSFNSDFIGTLDLVIKSQQVLTTYGNKIAVYTFGLNNQIDYPLFMGVDSQDTRGYNGYSGFNIPPTGNHEIYLDDFVANSLFVTSHDGSEIIKGFESFPPNGVMNVYQDNVSNTTCIATLTKKDYKKQLPLEVKGTLKYYLLNGGTGLYTMVLTRDVSRASRV